MKKSEAARNIVRDGKCHYDNTPHCADCPFYNDRNGCNEVELAEKYLEGLKMTEQELKTGMVVEMNDGVLRLVLGNTLVAISESGGGIDIPSLDKNLNWHGGKIMKIYSEPKEFLNADLEWWFNSDKKYILGKCELLWERKAEKKVKITITMNGETVDPKDISEETWENLRK